MKKDRRFLLLFFAAGSLLALMVFADKGFEHLWLGHNDMGVDVWAQIFLFAATPLGMFAALRERLFRTHDYVRHRPVPLARLALARHCGCALVLIGWIVVPPLVYLAASAGRPDFELLEGERFLLFLATGTVAFPFYAAGHYAASLSRRWYVVVLVGGAWPLLILTTSFFDLSLLVAELGLTVVVAVHLAVALLLLAASFAHERHEEDADRPPPLRALWLSVATSAVGLFLVATVWSAVLVMGFGSEVVGLYPHVVLAEGRPSLAFEDGRRDRFVLVDPEHRTAIGSDGRARPLDAKTPALFAPRGRIEPWSLGNPTYLRWTRRFDAIYMGRDRFAALDRETGKIEALRAGPEPGDLAYRVWLERPGRRFSAKTRDFPLERRGHALLFDPDDRSLWQLEVTDRAALTRLALPNDDRIVGLPEELVGRGLRWGRLSPEERATFERVVQGERGFYGYRDGSLALLPETLQGRLAEVTSYRSNMEPSGFLRARLELRDAAGRLALTHEYAPRARAERAFAFSARLVELLGPVVLRGHAAKVDPLQQAVALGLWAGLAGWVLLRTRRLGGSWVRAAGWAVAVLSGGLLLLLAHRLWETKRAWRPLEQAGAPKPALLITERPRVPSEEAAVAT